MPAPAAVQVVEPKIVALRGAENELKSATKEKDAAEAELAIVQSKLDAMQVLHAFTNMAVRTSQTALRQDWSDGQTGLEAGFLRCA